VNFLYSYLGVENVVLVQNSNTESLFNRVIIGYTINMHCMFRECKAQIKVNDTNLKSQLQSDRAG